MSWSSVVRRTFSQKLIRILAGAAAFTAPLLLLAPMLPANATSSTGAKVCSPYSGYCIGASNLNLNTPVVETFSGARYIVAEIVSGNSYLLAFQADLSKCVAAGDGTYLVVIHACNGGDGVVWKVSVGPDGKSCLFQSQELPGNYFSGFGDGNQFSLEPKGTFSAYQQYDTSNQIISFCGE